MVLHMATLKRATGLSAAGRIAEKSRMVLCRPQPMRMLQQGMLPRSLTEALCAHGWELAVARQVLPPGGASTIALRCRPRTRLVGATSAALHRIK